METILGDADISGCKVNGVSPWNVDLEGAIQNDLDISRYDDEMLTVDDLEIAHFTYLLINSKKLRNVIDTITSKVVLILGRFKAERNEILEAIKNALRERNYVPMLLDFTPSNKRDLTETIQLMENMAEFVIADIAEAKSIPQELNHIIPMLPSVPVQPIVLKSEDSYAMIEHWEDYKSVLPIFSYKKTQDLLDNLDSELIEPINNWKKSQDEKSVLRSENKEFREKLAKLQKNMNGRVPAHSLKVKRWKHQFHELAAICRHARPAVKLELGAITNYIGGG